MIDPLTVAIVIPALDGRIEAGLGGVLMSIGAEHLAHGIQILQGNSDVRSARNHCVAWFRSVPQFEWMVFWDSDIVCSVTDFKILMDYPAHAPRNDKEALMIASRREQNPEGTTVNDKGQALIVNAEYSRKVETQDPVRFGLGFTRVHRSVFDLLEAATDDDGKPRVGHYEWRGRTIADLFPNGVGFDGQWKGEDQGFFHLCRLCGIRPRIEQRTNLQHVGRKVFTYLKPTDVRSTFAATD